jgi:ATP-dependent Clp protease ATP-binding subunit ClpA
MNRDVYPKVKFIINKANEESRQLDDDCVRPEHIVMALIMDNQNECVDVLKKHKLDLMKIYDKIFEHLTANITPRLKFTKGNIIFSEESKKVPFFEICSNYFYF